MYEKQCFFKTNHKIRVSCHSRSSHNLSKGQYSWLCNWYAQASTREKTWLLVSWMRGVDKQHAFLTCHFDRRKDCTSTDMSLQKGQHTPRFDVVPAYKRQACPISSQSALVVHATRHAASMQLVPSPNLPMSNFM